MAELPLPRTIVFSHANSFPARTYDVLFERWRAQGYIVHAIEQFGHDPRYPVTPNWPHLVTQLHDFLRQEVGQPDVPPAAIPISWREVQGFAG